MKKPSLLFLFLSLLSPSLLFSQDIGFNGGYVFNRFYDLQEDEGHFNSDYIIGGGFNMELNVLFIPFKTGRPHPFKLSLNYQRFDGAYEIRNGGLGGSSTSQINTKVSSLELDWYFLCLQIFKGLQLNLGTAFDLYLTQERTGYVSSFDLGELSEKTIDETKYNLFNWGFTAETYYDIQFSENWYVVPRYRFYINIPDYSAAHSSYRHYINLGILRRI